MVIKKIKKKEITFFIEKLFQNKRNTLILSGNNVFKSLNLQKLKKNKKFFIILKNSRVSEFLELKKIQNKINKLKIDSMIVIGGGSVIDLAKLIFNFIRINYENNKFYYVKRNKKNKFDNQLFIIPTTAGSGSEATSFAVMYRNNKKFSINCHGIKKKIILVPSLVLKNPLIIKKSSAADSFCQSVEFIISKNANKESIGYAKKSIKIFINYYRDYIKKPNYKNSEKMLIASYYAGRAINISKTTAPHALSYFVSTNYNLQHGYAVSIFLIYFLKFNYFNISKNIKKKYKILFNLFKVKNFENFQNKINKILIDLNYLKNKKLLKKINKKKLIKSVNLERIANNPIKLNYQNLYQILDF